MSLWNSLEKPGKLRRFTPKNPGGQTNMSSKNRDYFNRKYIDSNHWFLRFSRDYLWVHQNSHTRTSPLVFNHLVNHRQLVEFQPMTKFTRLVKPVETVGWKHHVEFHWDFLSSWWFFNQPMLKNRLVKMGSSSPIFGVLPPPTSSYQL